MSVNRFVPTVAGVVALVVACAAANITPAPAIDTSTAGDWVGVYGQEGYILGSYDTSSGDRVSLPSYISSYGTSGSISRYIWNTGVSSPALQDPADTSSYVAACWYQGDSFSLTLNPSETRQFKLGLYLLDWDTSDRVETITIDGAGLAGSDSVASFHGGKWYVYDASATEGVPITISIQRTAGVNAVLSAVTFDVPEPVSMVLLSLGGLGILCRRR